MDKKKKIDTYEEFLNGINIVAKCTNIFDDDEKAYDILKNRITSDLEKYKDDFVKRSNFLAVVEARAMAYRAKMSYQSNIATVLLAGTACLLAIVNLFIIVPDILFEQIKVQDNVQVWNIIITIFHFALIAIVGYSTVKRLCKINKTQKNAVYNEQVILICKSLNKEATKL